MKNGDNMDKLYLEVPTVARKNEAYEFIREFLDNNSSINNLVSLHRYVNKEKNNYGEWLEKLEEDYCGFKYYHSNKI